MKILNAKQVYLADKKTIEKKSITSIDLMECAAIQCVKAIVDLLRNKEKIIHVFCGIGNNGGDGLVIARKLLEVKYRVKTYIVNFSTNYSNDFQMNLDRLLKLNHHPIMLNESSVFPHVDSESTLVDAIFGIGLSRPITGFVKKIIQNMNSSKCKVIAIDFPSGLPCNSTIVDKESVIKANYTLTFQNPKLAFFMPENHPYCGDYRVLDIGLDEQFIRSIETNFELLDIEKIRSIYKQRSKFSHKGTYGHALIIGGSYGKIGAVILASKAALKSGSGLVTAYIPKCGYDILQITNPEIMIEVDDEKNIQYFNYKVKSNVIGIGVGLGTHLKTINGFEKFLIKNILPLVLDADALNILANKKSLLQLIPENSVLTPHPKEFERLVGKWDNDYEKIDKLLKLSSQYKIVVVLKGANSAIAYKNKIYFNSTGNPALATAGSGDVLTGIITGLIAQNYSPIKASLLGVYLHGMAADIAVSKSLTMETFTASDCITYLSTAFKHII